MSAAAVIPAPRVVGTFIGPKASVAGPVSPSLNPRAQPVGWEGYCRARGRERPRVLAGLTDFAPTPGVPPVAKALGWNAPDGEGRKLGEQRGLDTPVVPAVNDAG